MFVDEESREYMAREVPAQQWSGLEPALQLLGVPLAHDATLAPYPTRPEHVPLEHCRLCMWSAPPDTETSQRRGETVGPLEPSATAQVWGLSSALAAHLQEAHELSPTEYRAAVNRQVVAQWPEPVSPATLRACVAAHKAGLSDAEYGLGVCVRVLFFLLLIFWRAQLGNMETIIWDLAGPPRE